MRKGNKGSKEQEEENAQILKGFVASEDPELIYELTDILGKGYFGPLCARDALGYITPFHCSKNLLSLSFFLRFSFSRSVSSADSSHGVVYKAINRLNGSIAAVKKLVSHYVATAASSVT